MLEGCLTAAGHSDGRSGAGELLVEDCSFSRDTKTRSMDERRKLTCFVAETCKRWAAIGIEQDRLDD
jgi:hypothetical protein